MRFLNLVIFSVFIFFAPILFASNISLSKSSFSDLPGWQDDNQSHALRAFQKSCHEILKRTYSDAKKWQSICTAANKIIDPDEKSARQFFERWFHPYHVSGEQGYQGVFTGYYLPLIHASLKRTKHYNIPIYALPKDLVKVDLGMFKPELAGKTIVGQVKNNHLSPYPVRAEIIKDSLHPNTDVIAWSDNLLDVYFSQVQGSAIIELPNKKRFMIGYAGSNGRMYTAIGKILVANNELSIENVSMQSIRAWLIQHPKQINQLLNQNTSYVFFQILKDQLPLGTESVALTKERSLAVDNRYIPFGAPIWLNTHIPNYQSKISSIPFQSLLIAQDTGGAIKGVVRGDVYLGSGNKAEYIAGHMNSIGEYWILLPS